MKKTLVTLFALGSLFFAGGCSKKAATDDTSSKNGTVELKIAYKDDNASNKNATKYYKKLSQILKKQGVNVSFKVVDLPSEGYADKLNLQISGGDIPDLIYFQGGDSAFAEQGILEDLRPYIKKSKYVKNIMTDINKARIENYPYLLWIKPATASVPVVKESELTQVDGYEDLVKSPTVENYQKLLTQLIGKKDGKGNQVKFGITTSGTTQELDSIFDMAFGNNKTWIKNNGKYMYKRVSKNEKNKLSFYKQLFDDGILDNEFLTKKWDTKEQAF